jgi:hypothetical protein
LVIAKFEKQRCDDSLNSKTSISPPIAEIKGEFPAFAVLLGNNDVTHLFSIIWCDWKVAPKAGRGGGETIFSLFSGTLPRFGQPMPIFLDKTKAKTLIGREKPVYNPLIPKG